MPYVIAAISEYDPESQERLYWSNEDGWVSREAATVFRSMDYDLPFGGRWETT